MTENERWLDELLGAYALDAVSDDERREIEEYLAVDPRARAEVEEHREVATMLAWSGDAAPDGLWEQIADQLDDVAPPPSGELAAVLAFDAGARRDDGGVGRSRSGRARRRSVLRNVGAWVGAAAAAAVIGVVVLDVARDDEDLSPLEAAVAEARDADGAIVTTLMSGDVVGGQAVIHPDGHGFLVIPDLPALSDDRTYQLWGVMDGEAISLGVLGSDPDIEVFTAAGPLTQLMITNEVAGGVVTNGNPEGAFASTLG